MKVNYTENEQNKIGTVVLTTGDKHVIIPEDGTAYVIRNKTEVKEI